MTAVTVVALFFVGMGLVALVAPERILALVGVRVTTVDGRNEVRAVYGGFGVAMGVVLLGAPRLPALRDGVLACAATALAGMACGRLVSAAIDRPPGLYPWIFFAGEVTMAGLLFTAIGS